ncbi:HYR domain-containing protein, partial [Aestuariivivens sp. NBU2969]|uniref:HYR domain-containing protein n=1 Tax=Aestuariivivens sp. NBU2969 TaxID=2873267 RepID=UPI001CBF14C2
MKTNTYKIFIKSFFLIIFIGVFDLNAQGEPNDCIVFTNCPQDNISICADTYNPDNPSEWGAILETWSVPSASETCSGGPGGPSLQMNFELNESLLGKDCWEFNYVQRVGDDGGYLRLFSSNGGPNSYIITPYLFLETTDTASIEVTYTNGDYDIQVYYIDEDGVEFGPFDTQSIDALGVGVHNITLDPQIPSDDSYRIKYEFVYTGSKPSNTNTVDRIGIDGVIIEGTCTGGIDFAVTGPEPPEFLTVGTHELCYTATYTDPNGTITSKTCCITVHVLDTPPVITCPSPITQASDPGLCTATVIIPSPTATDADCTGTDLTANLTFFSIRSDGLALTDPYPLGVTTITHSATDDNEVTVTCEQTVTITGGADPSFDSQPSPIADINCNDSLPVQETLTASDCNGPVTVVPSIDDYTIDVCAGYEITYRWTAGTTEVTQSFNVLPDTTPPSITTDASDSTVECDGSGNAAELAAWLSSNGGAAASDACGGVTWSNDYNALSDDCGATGSVTVIFTATDDCNNTSTTSATFTIEDTTPPTISVQAIDYTVECDGAGNTVALNAWLDTHAGAAASDACGGVTWSNDFSALSDDCGATGSVTVIFTATDDCNNSSTTSATFTIEDTTPPSITTDASDSTVECDGSGNAAELAAWLSSNGGASASDDCSGVTWSNNFTALSDDCGNTGSATVTFTATDECGLSSTTTATFTIEDTTVPSIDTQAIDFTVECDGAGNTAALNAWLSSNGGAVASDTCGGVTWSNDFSALSDDCGATGLVTVIFTATDDCNNSSTTSATFTIEDTTPPSITTDASDSTVECDGSGNAADLNAWLSSNGGAVASDTCGGVTWSNDYNALSDDCGAAGSVTVTFTATDDCNNSSTTSATFTIEDTTPPSITTDASDSTVECDGSGNAADLNAWLSSNGGAVASDTCGGVTWSNDYNALSDDCGATGSVTVIFTAT